MKAEYFDLSSGNTQAAIRELAEGKLVAFQVQSKINNISYYLIIYQYNDSAL
jgi:hypothetical protein